MVKVFETAGRVAASTPFNRAFIDAVKQLPGRRWDAANTVWTVGKDQEEALRALCVQFYGTDDTARDKAAAEAARVAALRPMKDDDRALYAKARAHVARLRAEPTPPAAGSELYIAGRELGPLLTAVAVAMEDKAVAELFERAACLSVTGKSDNEDCYWSYLATQPHGFVAPLPGDEEEVAAVAPVVVLAVAPVAAPQVETDALPGEVLVDEFVAGQHTVCVFYEEENECNRVVRFGPGYATYQDVLYGEDYELPVRLCAGFSSGWTVEELDGGLFVVLKEGVAAYAPDFYAYEEAEAWLRTNGHVSAHQVLAARAA